MQRLVISLAGQAGIDIAEVFIGGGIARMGADGHLQCLTGFFILTLRGIQHRQVVVGLGQLGIVLGQAGEDVDRIGGLVLFGQDQAA